MSNLVLHLQKKCYYNIKYECVDKTTIKKIYFTNSKSMIDWEIKVCQYLINKNIYHLPFNVQNNEIFYDMTNTIPLSECLQTKNLNLFLNEIFSFVNRFKTSNFIHGNINLYNLYYNKQESIFMISDFCNSNYKNNFPEYHQNLFNNLEVMYNIPKKYHDLFSLYLSLFYFFQNDKHAEKISIYLYDLLNDYVPIKYINIFLHNFYNVKNEKIKLGSSNKNQIDLS